MSGERLQKWALTAEIIGGIAILISLIFVGYEVRQSTKEAALKRNALEVSSYQNLMEGIMGLSQPLALDADFAEINLEAIGAKSETLTQLEKLRLTSFMVGFVRHGSMAFFQYQRGVIDQEQLDSVLSYSVKPACSPVLIRGLRWFQHQPLCPCVRGGRRMGWLTGFEPATPGTTNQCSNQLSYSHHKRRGHSWNPRSHVNPDYREILVW